MRHFKRSNTYFSLISFMVLILFLRPLIDLQGKFEGDGLNAGGIAGIFFVISCLYLFLKKSAGDSGKRWNIYIFLTILSIFLLYVVHFLLIRDSRIIVSGLRFLFGYSAIIFILGEFPNITKIYARKYFFVMVFISLIPVIIAVLQILGKIPYSYFDYSEAGYMYGRPTGGYYQPNSFARIMLFVFLITLVMVSARYKSKKTNAFISLMTLSSVVMSTHRTSIVVFFLCSAIYFIGIKLKMNTKIKFAVLWILIAVSPLFIKIIEPIYTGTNFQDSLVSGRGRYEIWEGFIEYFNKLPVLDKLFGVGYSVFEPHNDFANIIMQVGIFGLVTIIGILTYSIYICYRSVNRTGQVYIYMLVVLYFVYAINLQPSEYPYFMEMYFLTLSLIVGVNRKNISHANQL